MPPQMRTNPLGTLGAALFYLASALILFYTATVVHPLAGMLAPFAVLVGILLLRYPFAGVVAILLLSQMDAILDKLIPGIPGMKLLAAFTFSGLLLQLASSRVSVPRPISSMHLLTFPAIRLALLFFLWAIISSFFAQDGGTAVDSIARISPLLLLYLSVATLTDSLPKLRILSSAILLSTTASALVTIYDSLSGQTLVGTSTAATTAQWQGYARSAGATNYDPTTAAALLLTGVTMAAFAATLGRGPLRWLGAITVFVGSAGIVLSFARSSALGLLFVAACMGYRFRRQKAAQVLILISPILILVLLQLAPDAYLARLLTLFGVGEPDLTLDRRMSYHAIGLDLLLDHPLFGIGLGNFPEFYLNFEYRWIDGRTFTPRVLHNLFLSVFVETGLIGGSLFLGIVATSLYPAVKRLKTTVEPQERALLEAILASTMVLLLVAVTLPALYNKYIWALLGLSLASARILSDKESSK